MNHRFLYISLAISLGLNCFLVWDRAEDSNQLGQSIEDRIQTNQSALKIEKSYIPKARHENNVKFIEEEILPEKKNSPSDMEAKQEKEPFENYMDQEEIGRALEKRDKEVRSYMERDLGLEPDVASFYFELADKRQKEIDAFLSPKMGQETDEPYFFTIDDGVEVSRINAKYIELLKSAMGSDNYENFTKFRANMNQKMMEENGETAFWIEF